MADPLTAEELEMLADLQARKRAADEAAELADVQFRDAGIISEPLSREDQLGQGVLDAPNVMDSAPPINEEALMRRAMERELDRMRTSRMRMDGMGAGPKPPIFKSMMRKEPPAPDKLPEGGALEAMLDKAAEEDEME